MSDKFKVLHILNSLGSGGAESFIFNFYNCIDTDRIQFDFLIRSNCNNEKLVDTIRKKGGKLYIIPPFPEKYIENHKLVKSFFMEHHDYNVIHLHANALIYIYPLKVARKYNITNLIIHSHSTRTSGGPIGSFIHCINRQRCCKLGNTFLACSKDAGLWMFGKRPFTVVNNGIDTQHFKFDPIIRKQLRTTLSIDNQFVIGHVGRMEKAKNHSFILDIFKELLNIKPNSILLLIGDGSLHNDIVQKISQLNIKDKVMLLGNIDNVHTYLNAMDFFLFPSLYEGAPISLVEAQCSGLPCLISQNIGMDISITDLIHYQSLSTNAYDWGKRISDIQTNPNRTEYYTKVKSSGFDSAHSLKEMLKIYEYMSRK